MDFGSSCNLIRVSDCKSLNLPLDKNSDVIIKGYGSNSVRALGKTRIKIRIDNVERTMDFVVVPDHLQDVPILVGQPFTESPGLMVRKDSQKLEFKEHTTPSQKSKIELWLKEYVVIPPNHVGNLPIFSKQSFEGDLLIEACGRYQLGREYAIPRVMITLTSSTTSVIPVINLSGRELILNDKHPIVRAFPCELNLQPSDEHVLSVELESLPLLKEVDVSIGTDDVSVRAELMDLLNNFRNLFGDKPEDLGMAKSAEIELKLTDDIPFTYRPYRMAEVEKEKVRKIVAELLGANIIRDSESPYSSPILLVKKKNGQDRMCVDFRKLNQRTIKQKYPLPRIDDQIDKLSGRTIFTSLDLTSGYHQIPVAENSKHLTAFVTPDGHYEYNRMPFGLCNAPAVFQRLMNKILGPYRDIAVVYLDDVIIPSKTYRENLDHLRQILRVFRQENLTLNLKKCEFLASSINYLGFEIDHSGVRPGAAKIEVVRQFPIPKNVKQVRQFLGLTGFFRKFVKNYASIVRPLTALTQKNINWTWSQNEQEAFEKLKILLTQRPILALYDPNSRTEVHTDASQEGIAGILLQEHEGLLKPVAYYSRHTNKAESKYHSFELETLAVVESLLKFRVYLLGITFKVVTDCNALKTASSKRDLIPRIARWWLQLQEYTFTVEYRPGKSMNHVDSLSRNPCSTTEPPLENFVLHIEEADWILSAQLSDEKIKLIHEVLSKPPQTEYERDIYKNYALRNNRVYRITALGIQWVVPQGFRSQVVRLAHDDAGHFAAEKTLRKLCEKYWFPRMREYVEKYISKCIPCLYNKIPSGRREGYLHPIAKEPIPFYTIHIDHLGPFQKTAKGNVHLIVVVDAFTKFVILKPAKSTKTKFVIGLLEEICKNYGLPSRIITDRGTAFTSVAFKDYCRKHNIRLIQNAVATPRANGQVERINRTILSVLATSSETEDKWDSCINNCQLSINNTVHQITGKSPNQLLMGYSPREKNDILSPELSLSTVVKDMEALRVDVSRKIKENQRKQKKVFDKKRKAARIYKVGDQVLILMNRNAEGQSRKLNTKYAGPMVVAEVLPNDRYRVKDLPSSIRSSTRKFDNVISADRMKPWMSKGHISDETASDSGEDGVPLPSD